MLEKGVNRKKKKKKKQKNQKKKKKKRKKKKKKKKKKKRQPFLGKLVSNDAAEKDLTSKIYKQLIQLNSNKTHFVPGTVKLII